MNIRDNSADKRRRSSRNAATGSLLSGRKEDQHQQSGPGTLLPFSFGQVTELPIICETEKRLRINKFKELFFEKFVKG